MQSTKRTRETCARFFAFMPGGSSGPIPSRSARSGPGEYAPERPPDLSGTDTDKHAGTWSGYAVRRVTSHTNAGSRPPGSQGTNRNRHRTRPEPKPNRDTPGAGERRHGPGNRTRSDTGADSGARNRHRTHQDAPGARLPDQSGETDTQPTPGLYGPFSPLPRRSWTCTGTFRPIRHPPGPRRTHKTGPLRPPHPRTLPADPWTQPGRLRAILSDPHLIRTSVR